METTSERTGNGFVFSANSTTPCEDRTITYAMGSAMEKAGIDARGAQPDVPQLPQLLQHADGLLWHTQRGSEEDRRARVR